MFEEDKSIREIIREKPWLLPVLGIAAAMFFVGVFTLLAVRF